VARFVYLFPALFPARRHAISRLSLLPGDPAEVALERLPEEIDARRPEVNPILEQDLVADVRPASLRIAENIHGADETNALRRSLRDLHERRIELHVGRLDVRACTPKIRL